MKKSKMKYVVVILKKNQETEIVNAVRFPTKHRASSFVDHYNLTSRQFHGDTFARFAKLE